MDRAKAQSNFVPSGLGVGSGLVGPGTGWICWTAILPSSLFLLRLLFSPCFKRVCLSWWQSCILRVVFTSPPFTTQRCRWSGFVYSIWLTRRSTAGPTRRIRSSRAPRDRECDAERRGAALGWRDADAVEDVTSCSLSFVLCSVRAIVSHAS